MCGIAGIYNRSGRAVDLQLLEAMTQVRAHRGPDGEGYALMAVGRQEKPLSVRGPLQDPLPSSAHPYAVGFGHRRLAVVDLTLGGHQPMATPDECCWVTYNGEIYNYLELRDELRTHGHWFRFVTPEDVWFRTSLREFARDILSDARTRRRGYLNVDAALREFDAHAAGRKNLSFTIWWWLNLELWCRGFADQALCV
jgi:glutamine phosphoribosylpyrophosphate amidotransferase